LLCKGFSRICSHALVQELSQHILDFADNDDATYDDLDVSDFSSGSANRRSDL
jgi:hypothetical protein